MLGGSLPQRRTTAPALTVPPLEAFDALLQSSGDREISTTMALVRILQTLVKDKNIGKHIVPIIPGRGAHVRHGRHVPADRHLFVDGAAVHAAGFRPADVLQGGQEGSDPGRGHQRRRRAVIVHRRRHGVCEPQRQHGAVLHLLFHVRLPARRRFHLGGRRQSGARLPDRRNGGAYDARGRRACSIRMVTVTCCHRRCRTAFPTIRPSLTNSPSSCRTACVACTRTRKTSSITSPA